jgi:hypothetical protein
VADVLLTHHNFDHCDALASSPAAKVHAHRREQGRIGRRLGDDAAAVDEPDAVRASDIPSGRGVSVGNVVHEDWEREGAVSKSKQPLVLSVLCLLLFGCPPRHDVGGGDDDDDTTPAEDDDDDTPDDDDDVTPSDDDDDVTPSDDDDDVEPATCGGGLPLLAETEPNDQVSSANPISPTPAEGFCVEGTVTCGNADLYDDMDLFEWELSAGRDMTVRLDWTTAGDFDAYLWETADYYGDGTYPIVGYVEGFSSPEEGTGYAPGGTDLLLQVGCWDGTGGEYLLTVTYDEVGPGDDDDMGDDDDDDDDTWLPSSYDMLSFDLELTVEPTTALYGTYVISYWDDYASGLLGCEQHLSVEGAANFGIDLLGANCPDCIGLLTFDPASVLDVSDPATDPDQCDVAALDADNTNYGYYLTLPVADGGYGDFLSIALIDSATMADAGLTNDVGGTEDAAWFESTWSSAGYDFTHLGYLEAVPGSLSEVTGVDIVAAPAGPGVDWYAWWQFWIDPAVNTNGGWVMLGSYGGTSSWVLYP